MLAVVLVAGKIVVVVLDAVEISVTVVVVKASEGSSLQTLFTASSVNQILPS